MVKVIRQAKKTKHIFGSLCAANTTFNNGINGGVRADVWQSGSIGLQLSVASDKGNGWSWYFWCKVACNWWISKNRLWKRSQKGVDSSPGVVSASRETLIQARKWIDPPELARWSCWLDCLQINPLCKILRGEQEMGTIETPARGMGVLNPNINTRICQWSWWAEIHRIDIRYIRDIALGITPRATVVTLHLISLPWVIGAVALTQPNQVFWTQKLGFIFLIC